MEPAQVIPTGKKTVNCDGGGDALGHPRIFLTMPAGSDHVDCPYCGRRYIYEPSLAGHHADDH